MHPFNENFAPPREERLTVKQIIEAEHREHEAKTARLREARHVANAPSQM